MTGLQVNEAILTFGAVGATLFTLTYPVLARTWWRTQVGRAMEVTMLGLALLLDVALCFYWFGWTVPGWLARTIYVVIAVSPWLAGLALLAEQFRLRHPKS